MNWGLAGTNGLCWSFFCRRLVAAPPLVTKQGKSPFHLILPGSTYLSFNCDFLILKDILYSPQLLPVAPNMTSSDILRLLQITIHHCLMKRPSNTR